MSKQLPELPLKYLRPHQLGWLRRPELERFLLPGVQVWERPDGELMASEGEPRLVRCPGLEDLL